MSPCPKPFVPALIALLLWLTLPGTPVSAQDAGAAGQPDDVPLLSSAELTTSFYIPEHVHPVELLELAREFHGREIYIRERGGLYAAPLNNLQILGDSILIYDEPATARSIADWCQLVDQPRESAGQASGSAPAPLVAREWRPGYVSLSTALRALQPFQRQIPTDAPSTPRTQVGVGITTSSNIATLDEQGLLILRDTADHLDQMLTVLEGIDHPDAQLMVTAMVLRGTKDASAGEGVPTALVEDLSRLVPYEHFEMLDMGIVRAASRGREIGVRMAAGNQLMLQPEAYDRETSTLTARCTFRTDSGFTLETRTSLASDEYTVLGASGAVPIFVVLRIVSIR